MGSSIERRIFSLEIESPTPVAELLQDDIKWLQDVLLDKKDPTLATIARGLQRKTADRLLKLPTRD